MEFVGREHELALLHDHLARAGSSLFVLYGRRRIGKTALIEQALRSVPRAAYHVGTRSTITEELRRLSKTLARAWNVPLLDAQPLASPEALMAFLESQTERCVLVLDEFPYLAESDASLVGLLQASWDRNLSRSAIKLVCCGSSVSVMEDTFFGGRSPLFGRRTGQLRLGPLAPRAVARAFAWNPSDAIELVSLFGGIPGYLQRLDPELTLLENLRRYVLQQGEPLYEEIPFLLREELREPRVYHAILATIGAGSRKFGEISSKVGLDRANLTRYLAVLIDLGLVEREVPVTERAPERSRKGLYRISDPFVATWFTFVHPNRDALERGRVEEVLKEIRPRIALHVSKAVEPVLCDLLRAGELGMMGGLPLEVARAGRYWSPTAEFDVVLFAAAETRAVVVEVRWTEQPVEARELDSLRRRVTSEPAFAGVDVTCGVVSRAGFKGRASSDALLFDLSSLRWDAHTPTVERVGAVKPRPPEG